MDDPLAMAPKKPPAEKPKSPGGPTVIEADSADTDEAEEPDAPASEADEPQAGTDSAPATAEGEGVGGDRGAVPALDDGNDVDAVAGAADDEA